MNKVAILLYIMHSHYRLLIMAAFGGEPHPKISVGDEIFQIWCQKSASIFPPQRQLVLSVGREVKKQQVSFTAEKKYPEGGVRPYPAATTWAETIQHSKCVVGLGVRGVGSGLAPPPGFLVLHKTVSRVKASWSALSEHFRVMRPFFNPSESTC